MSAQNEPVRPVVVMRDEQCKVPSGDIRGGRAESARKLLITGCGRSGTKYTAFLLQGLGLDVQHERLGRDGVASWYMAVEARAAPFGPARSGLYFEHVYHQVRHPLAVVASAATFKARSWEYICSCVDIPMQEPLILRCAKYWYLWNLEAEKIAHWRYRVEDRETVLAQFCERLQIDAEKSRIHRLAANVNTRSFGRAFHWYQEVCGRLHLGPNEAIERWFASRPAPDQPTVSWDTLNTLDSGLTSRIRAKAVEYGYAL